jgi:hypothetical protein
MIWSSTAIEQRRRLVEHEQVGLGQPCPGQRG